MRDSSESSHFSGLDGFALGANDSLTGPYSIAKGYASGSELHGTQSATGGRVVVGDSHLLFSGHYARSGGDLVITDEGRKLLVPDYFKGTARADIYSREGASLSGAVVDALAGHTEFAQAGAAAPAGTPIGKVAKLTGTASVVRNGVTVELNIGDNVFKGDVVQAGQETALGITFVDGTAFSLGSNARMVLNDMVYDPNGSSNSSFLSLVQGTITFVAGQTAKNGSMRIDTPVATMGIRGTAVLVEIAANDGPTKFSVLVEPGNHVGSYELYNRVTGERIGTVNQAGIVTLVTPTGFNQLSISEQVKTLADMQAERDLIQQVFSMAFQKLNDANPKTNGGSSGSSYWLFGDDRFYQFSTDGQIKLTNLLVPNADSKGSTSFDATITVVPPPTVKVSNVSAPQAGGIGNVDDTQSSVSVIKFFNIGDRVVVDQTSVGTAPFYNIVVPYVPGTAVLANTAAPSTLPGSFNLASLIAIDPVTGKITYDPSSFQFLGKGETAVYTITFDSYGGPATANLTSNEPYTVHTTLTLTLVGLNDAPVFSTTGTYQYTGSYADALNGGAHALVGDTTGTTPLTAVLLTERPAETASNAADTATIVLNFTDQDFSDVTSGYLATGHTPTVSFVGASGVTGGLPADLASTFGASLSIDSLTKSLNDIHGQLTAHFTAPDHLFDYLAAGESVTLSYTIQITDKNGATGTETVNIVVTGTNDAPVLAMDTAASHHAVERVGTTGAPGTTTDVASGALSFADVDLSDTHIAGATLAAAHWSAGGGIPESSLAALGLAMTAAIGAFGDDAWAGADSTGTGHGTLTWDFAVADHAVDFLGCGETLTLTYDVSVADGHGGISIQPVTIVITGSNDVPTVSATSGAITERLDTTGSTCADVAHGTIAFADADLTDTHCLTVTGVTASGDTCGLPDACVLKSWLTLGSLSDSTGSGSGSDAWSFSAPDKYFDYLAAGETLTLSYTVQVDDHHGGLASQIVEVTITGANDPAVIGDPDVASVTEGSGVDANGDLLASGHITISDADHGQSSFRTDVVAHDGDLGVLTLQSDGCYVYSVANADVASLGADQTRTDVFTVTSADGTTKDVSFVIHGVNDAPVINLDHLSAVYTDEDRISFSGLHVNDADAASAEAYTLQVQAVYGTLSSNGESGTLATIDGDLAAGFVYQANEADEEHVETVTVSVTDGHGASDSLNFIFSTADFPTAQVVLNGTSGKDVFIGSDVAEQFVFAAHSGNDTIVNFTAGGDKIDLSSVLTTNDVDGWISQHATVKGSDTLITIDGQDSILLKNVALAGLHASDFIVSHS